MISYFFLLLSFLIKLDLQKFYFLLINHLVLIDFLFQGLIFISRSTYQLRISPTEVWCRTLEIRLVPTAYCISYKMKLLSGDSSLLIKYSKGSDGLDGYKSFHHLLKDLVASKVLFFLTKHSLTSPSHCYGIVN